MKEENRETQYSHSRDRHPVLFVLFCIIHPHNYHQYNIDNMRHSECELAHRATDVLWLEVIE